VRKPVEATEEGARTAARETQGLIGTIIVRATRAWRSLRRRLDDLVEKGETPSAYGVMRLTKTHRREQERRLQQ
jgi:Mg-chelatase subunit ChlD